MLKNVKSFFSLFFPYTFFAIVSTLLLFFAKSFSDTTLIDNPQFGLNEKYFGDLYQIAQTSSSYRYFFITDFLLTISIILIIRALFLNINSQKNIYPSKDFFKKTFIVFAVLSMIFDFWENIIYLFGISGNFHFVESLKMVFIAALIGLFVLYFMIVKIIPNWKKVSDILRSSFLSIFVLMIIGFGLTFMPQGASLVVHLLKETDSILIFNLIISFFLVNVLVLFISHFPIYINFAVNRPTKHKSNNPDDRIKWYLNNIVSGMGIITYHYKGEPSTWKKYMRHSLGILTYAVWFYVIIKAFDLYHLTHMDAFLATLIVTIGILAIYAFMFYKANETYNLFKDALYNKRDSLKDYYLKIKFWCDIYIISLLFTLIYAIVYFVSIYIYHIGWSYTGLIMILILMLMNTGTYILFRLTKGMWKYVWTDESIIQKIRKNDHQDEYRSNGNYIEIDKTQEVEFLTWLKKLLVQLNSNVTYVRTIRILGLLSFSILIISFFLQHFGDITVLNAVIILLAFIINVYALLTVALKHILFYKNFDVETHRIYSFSKAWGREKVLYYKKAFLPMSFGVILLLYMISHFVRGLDNLHKLDFVKSGKVMTVKGFEKGLKKHIDSMQTKRMVKIASFGGGLKSNLWNLLVLNQINKSSKGNSSLMDKCISLSGVSGGAVGLGNFLVLDYLYRDDTAKIDKIAQEIGELNILSIDMAGILINDFVGKHFSSFVREEKSRKDRAHFAMKEYIDLIAKTDSDRKNLLRSQQSLWYKMYQKHGYLPALIINTASTGLKPGVAFSLDVEDDIVFPGYIVLAGKGRDLKYYDAISTSNRFPVMSPAAQVEDKGFFLDGGYFENSGLLTTKYFSDVLKRDSILKNVELLTINIKNSRAAYIRKFIDSFKIEIYSIDFTTNSKAILSGITNIDKLPNVLAKAQKWYGDRNNRFCSVYMPHWITIKDIEKTIGGRIKLTDKIFRGLKLNNKKILDALDASGIDYSNQGIVEPPLARTLSGPAVQYEQAMIKYHVDCRKEIERIVKFIR